MQADSILFDLDGTLWDSVPEILLTWNNTIAGYPGLREPVSRAEQEGLMGLQMDEIARRLFPGETPARQAELMQACMEAENRYLYQHGGTLYPGVPQTLEALSKTFPLFIVSNCQSGYIEAFLHAHQLERFFTGFLCYGDTGWSKAENLKEVVHRYKLARPVYVGDTQRDLDSARMAGMPFVYAAYGFGSVTEYDAQISEFGALTPLMEPIQS